MSNVMQRHEDSVADRLFVYVERELCLCRKLIRRDKGLGFVAMTLLAMNMLICAGQSAAAMETTNNENRVEESKTLASRSSEAAKRRSECRPIPRELLATENPPPLPDVTLSGGSQTGAPPAQDMAIQCPPGQAITVRGGYGSGGIKAAPPAR